MILIESDSNTKIKCLDIDIESNNINKLENDNNKDLYFLKYNSFSCRYDAYFFVESYVINFNLKRNNYNLNENLKSILEIRDFLLSLKKEELDKGFWFLIDNYNLDKLGIMDDKNGYKKEFPITNIFQWLNNNSIFCIRIKELVNCLSCGFKEINESFLNPLITIYIDDINLNSLSDILIKLKEPSCGACETCSYENERIKNNIFYHTCKQKIIKNFILSDFLFFIFEFSDEKDLEKKQYENLILLKDSYKHLIVESFNFENFNFNLIGTINQSSFNHYTSCIINNNIINNSLKLNCSYYYDDFTNNNKIKEIKMFDNKSIIDTIIDYHPIILIYSKC